VVSLRSAKLKAKREGWLRWVQSEVDEVALTQGCYFDPYEADHIAEFFEEVLTLKGDRVELLPHQRTLLMRTNGWRRPDHTRRIRQVGAWWPKKNAKSWTCSGLILYLLCADGEQQAEVFSVATSTDQGRIVFREAANMARSSHILSPHLEVVESTRRIVFPATNSFYQVLSSRAASAEGYSISGLVVDELHRHRSDDLFNALRWGGAARRQPLLVTISTAGVFDPTSIAWKQYEYAKAVRDNALPTPDTSFEPSIYEAEPEDDWQDPDVWHKANPALGTVLSVEDFTRDCEEAKQSPHRQNAFLRYRLNLWTNSITAWISDAVWGENPHDRTLTPDQERAITWYGGLDLASTTDIAAFAAVGLDAEGYLHIRPTYWISEEQAKKRTELDGVNYLSWVRQKLIRATPGYGIDYSFIRRDLNELADRYKFKLTGVDAWNACQLLGELDDDGWPIGKVRQGFQSLSPPTKELERLIVERKVVCPCPVFRWMLRNVVLEVDAAANIKPSKKRSREKIDGVVAAVMALFCSLITPHKPSMYEQRAAARAAAEAAKAAGNADSAA
jgi:phage terminase large subunit-like protein